MALPLLFLAAAAAAAPAAPAAMTPEQSDARCVVILGFIARQPNQPAERMEAVKTGTAYYLGKLQGRRPGIAIGQVLGAAATSSTAPPVPSRTIAACWAFPCSSPKSKPLRLIAAARAAGDKARRRSAAAAFASPTASCSWAMCSCVVTRTSSRSPSRPHTSAVSWPSCITPR